MKVYTNPNCGNAPKQQLIKELTIYFCSYELDKAREYLDEHVEWTLVGDKPVKGRDKFLSYLNEMSDNSAVELSINSIVTHGKEGAVSGEMKLKDGSVFAFGDFFTFNSASFKKVKTIVSFVQKI